MWWMSVSGAFAAFYLSNFDASAILSAYSGQRDRSFRPIVTGAPCEASRT